MQLETEIEVVKMELALKEDFNLVDAFRLFDTKIKNKVYLRDVSEGLRVNLEFNDFLHEEVYLWFKRID